MKRGELYRVADPSNRDPKRFRVFVVVSRQALIETRFSSVICAPVMIANGEMENESIFLPDSWQLFCEGAQ